MTTNTPPDGRPVVTDKDLSGAAYTNVRLQNAAFTDIDLKRASFTNANLSDATFANVTLTNATIRDARLDGMTIDGVLVPELLRAYRDRPDVQSSVVFHVRNLLTSLEFYTRILGFAVDFKFGKPETYAGLSWKNVHLHISSSYPYKDNTGHGSLYIHCGDIDRLYEQLDSAGVEFYSRIRDREYGMRDFAIKDPDGNQIGFGAELRALQDGRKTP